MTYRRISEQTERERGIPSGFGRSAKYMYTESCGQLARGDDGWNIKFDMLFPGASERASFQINRK